VINEIAGSVGVVTGGASGIGLATAERLAHEGMHLLVADIDGDAARTAATRLAEIGVRTQAMAVDVSDLAQVQTMADQAFADFGRVDFVFNNAGVYVSGPIAEMTHDDWRWTIDVDLWGPIHGVEVFLPYLIEQGTGGHITNTSSFAGLAPNVELGAYCVAKYGVVALSEVLHREVRQHNIGVSVLCPMRLATDIDSSGRNRTDKYGGKPEELAIEIDEEEMAGRLLGPEAAAAAVLYGIQTNTLYLHTHIESRRFVQRRFERIDNSFDGAPGL
jgi:NAD(P)-dependent dehydrogenase (short-subunit alcohol dehydrogenase family)